MKKKRRTGCLLFVLLLVLVLLAAGLLGMHAWKTYARQQPGEWYHFLLVGTDSRHDVNNEGRSDTMMVCSVHTGDGRVKLASFARDMWVTIPGRGEGKLNAAHSWGGPELLLQTLNQNFGLPLKDYVSVNFYGLIDIVDAIGGVEIELTKAEASTINNTIAKEHPREKVTRVKAGKAHLCGLQALTYARIRKLDNDFGRTARQRKLLSAMLERVKGINPFVKAKVARQCLEYVTLQMDLEHVQMLAMLALSGGLGEMEELSLPSKGHYRYGDSNGVSKVLFDAQQVAQEWQTFVYEE